MLILDCVVDCESFEVLVLLSCLTLETGLALEALLTLYSFFILLFSHCLLATASIYTTFKDAKFNITFSRHYSSSYCIPLPVKLKV